MNYLSLFFVVFFLSYPSYGSNKCKNTYVPEHTQHELMLVKKWAAGGAFADFAKKAGYEFDNASYIADCPNWALFGFSLKTGTACLNDDLLNSYISIVWAMNNLIIKENDPDAVLEKSFQEFYDEYARKLGFDIYLTPIVTENS